jgi:hypothetical protein
MLEKLHNEGINSVYSLPNRIIKSRRMRWAKYVARMGGSPSIQGFGVTARRKETTRKTQI